MPSPEIEAAEIIAAASDRMTAAIEAQTAALTAASEDSTRSIVIAGLLGQLFSNVAFRHNVRVPTLTVAEKDEVTALAADVISM